MGEDRDDDDEDCFRATDTSQERPRGGKDVCKIALVYSLSLLSVVVSGGSVLEKVVDVVVTGSRAKGA